MQAALSVLYTVLGGQNPVLAEYISTLNTLLINMGTQSGRMKSKAMPIKPFHDLFTVWPNNKVLSIKKSQTNGDCLTCLRCYVSPSDGVPRSARLNPMYY